MANVDDMDAFLASLDGDEEPTAVTDDAAPSNPVKEAAQRALDAFTSDAQRVRTAEVGSELLAFIVTTKSHGSGPTIHAGVEPAKTVEASDALVADLEVVQTVRDREHRCWTLRVGTGQLARVWIRKPGEDRNGNVAYWAIKRTGECKRLDEATYRRLRSAL